MFNTPQKIESGNDSMLVNIVFTFLLITPIFLVLWLTSCFMNWYVQDIDAAAAIRSSGYSDVRVGTTSLWLCPGDGERGTKFSAYNSQGKKVYGLVCYTSISGHQIRLY